MYVFSDYDIALVRINYPVQDDESGTLMLQSYNILQIFYKGMTVLYNRRFNVSSIMPICLPPSRNFKDDDRGSVVVGMGIAASQ